VAAILGFAAACPQSEHARQAIQAPFAAPPPTLEDYPDHLAGEQGKIRERDPSVLYALAWPRRLACRMRTGVRLSAVSFAKMKSMSGIQFVTDEKAARSGPNRPKKARGIWEDFWMVLVSESRPERKRAYLTSNTGPAALKRTRPRG